MADLTFQTVFPALKAVDNGDGTWSVAVNIPGMPSFTGMTAGELLVATGATTAAWQNTGVKLDAPDIQGVVTAASPLTMPPFTAGGNITMDGTETVDGVDISVHAVATTAVHDVGGNHIAEFGQAGQVVSKIVGKDASESALNLANQSSSTTWTDLDLTAYTSADAKWAYLRLAVHIDSYASGYVLLRVRKNGTTPTRYPLCYGAQEDASSNFAEIFVWAEMDSGQVIEYDIFIDGTAQADFNIDVLGYIE